MRCTRLTKSIPMSAALLIGLLIAACAIPLCANPAAESRPAQGLGPVYDAAHETTLIGTIQEVVTKHTAGSPAGMHLLVAGAQGVVDAHVGPFLSKETKDALQTGMPVQIVGAMLTLHGKDYLLARELNIGGNIITVRSKHGALAHEHTTREHVARSFARSKGSSQIDSNGGVR